MSILARPYLADQMVAEILVTDDNPRNPNDPEWCMNCGHIVFVENVSPHYWIRKVLIEV